MKDVIAALRNGEQADMDGTFVKVSRQACEEAANWIERMQKCAPDCMSVDTWEGSDAFKAGER